MQKGGSHVTILASDPGPLTSNDLWETSSEVSSHDGGEADGSGYTPALSYNPVAGGRSESTLARRPGIEEEFYLRVGKLWIRFHRRPRRALFTPTGTKMDRLANCYVIIAVPFALIPTA